MFLACIYRNIIQEQKVTKEDIWVETKKSIESIESIDANLSIKIKKSCKKSQKYSIQIYRVLNRIENTINYITTINLLYQDSL